MRRTPTDPTRTPDEAARIAGVLAPPADFTAPEPFETKPAGAATTRLIPTADAFSQFSPNMAVEREMDFKIGNGIFRKLWVGAPSSTRGSDGLGPLFNARACQNCHIKDGRGHMPDGPDDSRVSAFLRLSVPGGPGRPEIPGYHPTRPDPVYGGQLQDLALEGYLAEARMGVRWSEQPVTLADGTVVNLRAPTYAIEAPAYGPPHPALQTSPRVAPQMIGLGLIAGYSRKRAAQWIMRLGDVIMSFPSLLLAVIVLYILGPSVANLIVVLAITRIPVYLRTTRAEVMEVRERMFVQAARVMGASRWRIIFRHILPVVLPTLLTVATLDFAFVMLAESSLSFLGIGIQAPEITWGLMVSQGRQYLTTAWWLSFWPGLAIILTTLSLNLLSNWLRIALDPVQRWRLEMRGRKND